MPSKSQPPVSTTFQRAGSRPRLAALVVHRYPAKSQASCYQRLETFATQLGADLGIFHGAPEDPTELASAERALLGGGVLVPPIRQVHYDAIDHFRYSRPDAFAALLSTLETTTGLSAARILARPDVAAAFGYCRWLQAWQADLVCTFFLHEMALAGYFAKSLLGLPWVQVLLGTGWRADYEALLGVFLGDCDALLLGGDNERNALAARFPSLASRAVSLWGGSPSEGPVATLGRLLDRGAGPSPAPMGVRVAFVTKTLLGEPPARQAVEPFVIIGAERTGSNLLVGAVAQQKAIACAGELFNPKLAEKGIVPWFEGSPTDPNLLHAIRKSGARNLHARLIADAAAGGAVRAGFKLLYYQGLVDYRILSFLAGLPELKVVHLFRENRLRRWISHHRAETTDSWYVAKGNGKPSAAPPITLDAWETVKDFAYITMLEGLYSAFFAPNATLNLVYEEFSADLGDTGNRFAEFLNVPIQGFEARSRKTGAASLRAEVDNLDQIAAALSGTRWAQMAQEA